MVDPRLKMWNNELQNTNRITQNTKHKTRRQQKSYSYTRHPWPLTHCKQIFTEPTMKCITFTFLAFILFTCTHHSHGFAPVRNFCKNNNAANLASKRGETDTNTNTNTDTNTDTYETSNASSKGLVSSLTSIVNLVMGQDRNDPAARTGTAGTKNLPPAPRTPNELKDMIQQDYTEKNYLWTGDIYLPAFESDCKFIDPTLSFIGTQKFVSNVKNLVPIVDFLTERGTSTIKNDDNGTVTSTATGTATGPRSELLDISLNEKEGYVQTRWNMVGDLSRLPWKPAIDVIGRTKFWYNRTNDNGQEGYRVYFYDEEWELAAGTALLQLITPKGSIPNSNIIKR